VDLIGKGGPNLLVPSGRLESIHLLVLCLVDEISISFFGALDCEKVMSSLL